MPPFIKISIPRIISQAKKANNALPKGFFNRPRPLGVFEKLWGLFKDPGPEAKKSDSVENKQPPTKEEK